MTKRDKLIASAIDTGKIAGKTAKTDAELTELIGWAQDALTTSANMKYRERIRKAKEES